MKPDAATFDMVSNPIAPPAIILGDRDGETFDRAHDRKRLDGLMARVFSFMNDRQWHAIQEVQEACGGTEASCSARIRDLRKQKFGGYQVSRLRCGHGLYKYRLAGKAGEA